MNFFVKEIASKQYQMGVKELREVGSTDAPFVIYDDEDNFSSNTVVVDKNREQNKKRLDDAIKNITHALQTLDQNTIMIEQILRNFVQEPQI